jgi:hypothetical protein
LTDLLRRSIVGPVENKRVERLGTLDDDVVPRRSSSLYGEDAESMTRDRQSEAQNPVELLGLKVLDKL